jgi:hypothetical protein
VWASSDKKKQGGAPWTVQEFQLLRHQAHEQAEATPEEVAAFLKSRVRKS